MFRRYCRGSRRRGLFYHSPVQIKNLENEDAVVVDSYTEDYVEPDTIIGEIENNENDMKDN